MALDTFSNLKQSIERFSKRTDTSDVIDDLIKLCEVKIDSKLRLRANEQRATATLSTRFLALPDLFLEMRRLTIVGAKSWDVRFKAPDAMEIQADSGRPRYFTVTSQLEFDRVPDSSYTIEMSYYTKLSALSTSNTTNDVLTNYPDLYLYGTLAELHRWARDEDTAAYYDQVFKNKMFEVSKQDKRGRYGPAPTMIYEGSTP